MSHLSHAPITIRAANSFETQEQLQIELDALVRANEAVLKENAVFESFLVRNVKDFSLEQEYSDYNAAQKKGRLRMPGGGRGKEQLKQLTPELKVDVAQKELEEAREELARAKSVSDRLLDALKASLEEIDVRIAEIKKDNFEFKRDIVVGGENPRTGKPIGEKVVKYMEDSLQRKEAMTEKLRLRNETLRVQIRATEAQLQDKEKVGDGLHAIDFHQLEIENKQFLEKIEDRNDELLALKVTTGNTVQVLNGLKKKLATLTAETDWLKREIAHRDAALIKLNDEVQRVFEDREQAAKANQQLLRRQKEYEMQPVINYIDNKAEYHELKKAIKTYGTKVQISEKKLEMLQRQARAAAAAGATRN